MRLPPAPKKPDPVQPLLAPPAFDGVPVALVPHCQGVPWGVLVRLLRDRLLQRRLEHRPYLTPCASTTIFLSKTDSRTATGAPSDKSVTRASFATV